MMRRAAAVALLALAGGGCNVELLREHPLGCRSDEQPMVRDTLYFGASIPGGGEVSDADWRGFEAQVLTPAFPQGYSVLEGNGHWRGADGSDTREHSRVVVITHPDNSATAQAVRRIAQSYRERFRQEAVLRERGAVCVQF